MLFTDTINYCAEVAGMLWQKGWAERNGGNLVVDITEQADANLRRLPALTEPSPIGWSLESIGGRYFYCKGSGKRMRDLARKPMDNGCIIRINDEGTQYSVVACKPIMPTSELGAHLAMHNYLRQTGSQLFATLHTHPTELVAMSHVEQFCNSQVITQHLWAMIPETRMFCPKGLGFVEYAEPGSRVLAEGTLEQLKDHDAILWEKHGVVAAGTDIVDAFDTIDILNKAAQISCAIGNFVGRHRAV